MGLKTELASLPESTIIYKDVHNMWVIYPATDDNFWVSDIDINIAVQKFKAKCKDERARI